MKLWKVSKKLHGKLHRRHGRVLNALAPRHRQLSTGSYIDAVHGGDDLGNGSDGLCGTLGVQLPGRNGYCVLRQMVIQSKKDDKLSAFSKALEKEFKATLPVLSTLHIVTDSTMLHYRNCSKCVLVATFPASFGL